MNIFQAITCFILSTCTYEEIDGPNQIHLSLGDHKHEMVVSWAELEPRNGSQVQWGLDGDNLDYSSLAKAREIHNFGRKIVSYFAVMDNLRPDTTYYYRVGADDKMSDVLSFTTFPDDPDWQPKICIFGDLGWKNGRSIARINNETLQGQFDVLIHIGDIAYDLFSDRGRVGDRFLLAIEPAASKVPYMVIPGNHEYMPLLGDGGDNYHKRFKMPGQSNNDYYTFKVGKIRFVVISTEFYYILEGGSSEKVLEQITWMEKVLSDANKAKNRKECPWLIVLGHRPVYCSDIKFGRCPQYATWLREGRSGKYGGLEEIFYKYGVDIYFAGHNHQYERSKPVHKFITTDSSEPYLNPNSTIYVISGAGGNAEGLDDFKKREPKWSGFRAVEYGFTRMYPFNTTHLLIEQEAINGTLLDSFTVIQYNHRMFANSP